MRDINVLEQRRCLHLPRADAASVTVVLLGSLKTKLSHRLRKIHTPGWAFWGLVYCGAVMQLWPCCATHRGALQLASTPWPGTMWAMTSANHCLTAASSRVPGKAGCRQPGPLVWQWVGQLVRNAAWVLRRGARASIMAWCGGWGRVIHASLISRNEPPPVASRRRKAWCAHPKKKRKKRKKKRKKEEGQSFGRRVDGTGH